MMRKVIYILGLLLAVVGRAQEGIGFPKEHLELLPETAVEPGEYRLDCGDSLLILISGPVNYSYPTVVTPEGDLLLMVPSRRISGGLKEMVGSELSLDVVAKARVSGQTIIQAQATIKEAFSRYFRGAMPEILLLTPRQFKVYVLGAVKFPGAYTASPFLRASDLIQKAGGIIPFGAQHRIELKELGGATLTADLVKFEQTGDFRYNPRIETGMVIFVPLSKQIVRVRGALQGAGLTAETVSDTSVPIVEQTYDLKEGETFLDLVLRAGGPTSQADLRRCYIERPSGSSLERTEVDLYEILREGETAHNPTLRPGDVVVVPFLSHQVYVVGEVSKPGSFALSPGYTVTDYIGLAGGPTLDADLGGTRVIRADGQELSSQDDPVIRYGDTILVPVRAARTWQGFISIASVLTSMILSFLALTR